MIVTPTPKDKFCKDVELNGCKRQAFINMGSSCSLITTSLACELNLAPFQLNAPVVLTGFKIDSCAQVTQGVLVDLKVDTAELNITLYVCDLNWMVVPFL